MTHGYIRGKDDYRTRLLDDHWAHCVVGAARDGGPDAEGKLGEVSDAIARLVRS